MHCIVKTLEGLESITASELEALGVESLHISKRAIAFEADMALLYKVNYRLRTASRVLVQIKNGHVKSAEDLYEFVSRITWEDYFDIDQTFAIASTVNSPHFQHSLFVSLKSKDAIVDRFRKKMQRRPNVDTKNPQIQIHVYILGEDIHVSLDASGQSLHKRGYKVKQSVAPLSESLAAAMIQVSGYNGETPLYNPMCGSGTIGIEAFMHIRNIPASYFRKDFSMFHWRHFNLDLWNTVKREEDNKIIESTNSLIYLSDADQYAVEITRKNIEVFNAFGPTEIHISRQNFFDSHASNGGLLILNPPYDEKIKLTDTIQFYSDIGSTLKHHYGGTECWVVSGSVEGMQNIGLKPSAKWKLMNGKIPVQLNQFRIFVGKHKEHLKLKKAGKLD